MVGPSINSNKLPLKFLCSYGGKILPRHSDGKLRYYGGDTRVLSVERSISFAELLVKLREMCGAWVNLRCQLPTEDLDSLVSITSDEDLANLIEEYDRSSLKIRAFLSPQKTTKKVMSPLSSISSTSSTTTSDVTSPNSSVASPVTDCPRPYKKTTSTSTYSHNCPRPYKKTTTTSTYSLNQFGTRPPMMFPICHREKVVGKPPQYGHNSSHIYLIHHGNHWQ